MVAEIYLSRPPQLRPLYPLPPQKWSLQTNGPDLFRLDGNNFYPEKGHLLPDPAQIETLDIRRCYLRVERQALIRLAESKAVVFCVRSYLTPLEDIKSEGNGVELADAIESMPEKLGRYNKRPFWEQDVYDFLRKGGLRR